MLEYVVRPFSSTPPQGGVLIAANPGLTTDTAILKWGTTATMPTLQSSGINVVSCNEGYTESSRESSQVKITNPNDSSQFIMVARATSVSMAKKSNDPGIGSETTGFASPNFSSEVGDEVTAALGNTGGACNTKFNYKNTQNGQ